MGGKRWENLCLTDAEHLLTERVAGPRRPPPLRRRMYAAFTEGARGSTGTNGLSGEPGPALPPRRAAQMIWVVGEWRRCRDADADLDQEGPKAVVEAHRRAGWKPRLGWNGQVSTTRPFHGPPTATLASETCVSRVGVLTEAGDGVATLYHAPLEDK